MDIEVLCLDNWVDKTFNEIFQNILPVENNLMNFDEIDIVIKAISNKNEFLEIKFGILDKTVDSDFIEFNMYIFRKSSFIFIETPDYFKRYALLTYVIKKFLKIEDKARPFFIDSFKLWKLNKKYKIDDFDFLHNRTIYSYSELTEKKYSKKLTSLEKSILSLFTQEPHNFSFIYLRIFTNSKILKTVLTLQITGSHIVISPSKDKIKYMFWDELLIMLKELS